MNILTRAEELSLIAVYKLGNDAYSVHIRKFLKEATGESWSFGAVYMALDRLLRKKFVDSDMTEPTGERGGRSKRVYAVTKAGMDALYETRRVQDHIWQNMPNEEEGKTA